MKFDESSVSLPFQAIPENREDQRDSPVESPSPSDSGWDTPYLPVVERDRERDISIERDIYGDERGGQIPKRP